MSIILKTQAANSVVNPAYGKRTIFFTADGQMQIKDPDGNGTNVITASSSGNVLIGTTTTPNSTTAGIQLAAVSNGTISAQGNANTAYNHWLFINNNGTVGSIQSSGSSTTYNTSSDMRLKENITDAPSASALIDNIQVRSFDWKIDGKHQEFGMIAQELMEVVPDAVSQSTDNDQMMGIDYSKLVPMLVKEIQELRSRLSQLENVVNNN